MSQFYGFKSCLAKNHVIGNRHISPGASYSQARPNCQSTKFIMRIWLISLISQLKTYKVLTIFFIRLLLTLIDNLKKSNCSIQN